MYVRALFKFHAISKVGIAKSKEESGKRLTRRSLPIGLFSPLTGLRRGPMLVIRHELTQASRLPEANNRYPFPSGGLYFQFVKCYR
jgi:hypothetical protein